MPCSRSSSRPQQDAGLLLVAAGLLLLLPLNGLPFARAQGGAATPADGVGPWLGDLVDEMAKDTPLAPIKKMLDAMDLASFADNVARNCLAAGGNARDCAGFAGWCTAVKLFTPVSIGPIPTSMILPPIDKYCLGEPVLKCCKTNRGCHSAFNTPAPINCEGNPHYGPTYTPGLCLRPGPGRPGCVCDYLPECLTGRRRRVLLGEPEPMSFPEDAPRLAEHDAAADPEFLARGLFRPAELLDASLYRFHNLSHHNITRYYVDDDFHFPKTLSNLVFVGARRDAFIMNLTTSIRKLPASVRRSRGFRDLVTYRGCKGWLTDIAERLDVAPKNLTIARYGVRNQVVPESDVFGRAVRFARYAQYVAAFRTLERIPNFWGRIDLLVSFRWGPASIQTHLALLKGTTPDKEAARLLSPVALAILKNAQPTLWPLLFVPLDYERRSNSTSPPPRDERHCELGSPPELHVDTKTDPTSRSVLVRVRVAPSDASQTVATPVRISWGDGRVESISVSRASSSEPELEHSYAKSGAYRVLVSAMSVSGHHRLVSHCVLVGVDSPTAPGWTLWPPPAASGTSLRGLTLYAEAIGHHRFGQGSGEVIALFHYADSEPVRDMTLAAHDTLVQRSLGSGDLPTYAPADRGSFSATPYTLDFDHPSGSRVGYVIARCRSVNAYRLSQSSIAVRDVTAVYSAEDTGLVLGESKEDSVMNVNLTIVRAFRHWAVATPSSKDGDTRIERVDVDDRGVYSVLCTRPGWNVWQSLVLEVVIPDDARSMRATEGCRRTGHWQGVRENLEEVLGPLLGREKTAAVTLEMRHLGDNSSAVISPDGIEETCTATVRVHGRSGHSRVVASVDVDDVGAVEALLSDYGLLQQKAFSFVGERSWACLTDCVPHCQGREWRSGRWTWVSED